MLPFKLKKHTSKNVADTTFKELRSMQDLENNNQMILDPLGNINEIYANLTLVTLLNRNHF